MTFAHSYRCQVDKLLLSVAMLFLCSGTLFSQTSFESLAKSATAAREAGDTPQALRDYQAAVQLHPDWQEGWWYLGTLQYDVDNYAAAIPALQKLLALDPQNLAAAAFLGLSEFQTKHYEDSYAHLQQAKSLPFTEDPELYRVAQYHLALLQIRSGNFAEAVATLTDENSPPASQRIRFALGSASLRVALLPQEVDPSRESTLQSAGEAFSSADDEQYLLAFATYTKLLRDNPELPYLHYAYGQALESAKQPTQALSMFLQETKLSPQSPLPFLAISRIEQSLGHTEKARKAADTASQLSQKSELRESRILALYSNSNAPSTASTTDLWNQAMQAYSSKQYDQAAAALKSFVATNPTNGTAWAVLGLSEFALKEYDNALLHLQRGNELGLGGSADSVQLAKYTLAVLLNRRGAYDSASRLLAGESGLGAHSPQIQFVLGMSLLHIAGLPEEVRESQRPLITSAGEIASLLQQSKYEQALPKLQLLIKQNPSTPFLHYAYGVALSSLSEYPEAEAQFREEARISPSSELPQIRLASIALRARRPTGAVNPAKRALELAPNSAEAHYLLGRAYLDLGQTADAVHELETATKLEPGSPEIHFNLAKAYTKAQQPEKAERERATFTRLNSLAEKQKSLRGNQSYGGSHDATDVSLPTVTPSARATQQEKQ